MGEITVNANATLDDIQEAMESIQLYFAEHLNVSIDDIK